ncbi:MAG: hypothetical protein RR736_23810 [Pseudomonas sp.]|uniref:hypothetical protein n=1 Tax=Pseudomonas sp. TaxID=306 RepID=UPI002FC685A5
MTEQEAKDIVERIEHDLNNQQAPAVSVSHIEIHSPGLWAHIPQVAGVHYLATATERTLFGIPASLGVKANAPYTIHFTA